MPDFALEVKTEKEKASVGTFVIEPLVRGFGHTMGNSLRRVLLGQLSGTAITKLKVNDIPHEFSPIPGVVEDVVELILNLKKIHFQADQPKTNIVTLEATGEKEITAGDLNCPTGIRVANPDLHVATLSDKNSTLDLTLTVEYGKGYHLPEDENKAVGEILLDSDYSPITRVDYQVESARVGRLTNLDKLILTITTNGTITPSDALKQAAAILVDHFSVLADGTEITTTEEDQTDNQPEATPNQNNADIFLEEIQIPTRVLNTLKKANLYTIEDVKAIGEEGLSKIKNIGPKTITMIFEKIEKTSR